MPAPPHGEGREVGRGRGTTTWAPPVWDQQDPLGAALHELSERPGACHALVPQKRGDVGSSFGAVRVKAQEKSNTR